MHTEADGKHTYSHTSLSLWRLCPRKWFNRYILGRKDTVSAPAAFSVHLVHEPLAAFFRGDCVHWETLYKAFSEEMKGSDNVDDFHSLGAGKRILDAVRKTPPGFATFEGTESERFYDFGVAGYTSRPDLIGILQGRRYSLDWKYSETKWKTEKQPWPLKGLLPYDDQLLGQAVLAEADGFIRGTIRHNTTNGAINGPIYEECLVDTALRQEWLRETKATIIEIEACLASGVFAKDTGSCYAFGRPCEHIKLCKGGFDIANRKPA